MAYHTRYDKIAINALKKIQKSIRKRIVDKIYWLSQNVEDINHKSLQGNLANFYKLRVGDYRVIYELDHETKTIIIDYIGHRREIYK